MMKYLQVLAALFLTTPGLILAQEGEKPTAVEEPGEEEYQIYSVVLEFLKEKGMIQHPIIGDRTSTFQCGRSCNGMLVSNCSGMRAEDETAAQALTGIREKLPALDQETVEQFEQRNESCVEIHPNIPTKLSYFLFGPDRSPTAPKDWTRPDFLYFSRAATNTANTRALVYFVMLSVPRPDMSGGYYMALRKDEGQWKPDAILPYWVMNPK